MTGSTKQSTSLLITVILAIFSSTALPVHAGDDPKPVAQEESSFYTSTVLPALNKLKQAMPLAPAGWTIAGETKSGPLPQSTNAGPNYPYRFTYQIQYKRVAGMKDEKKRLNEVYTESSERHGEEANAQINDLLRQQTTTSLALRKATRRKNQAEMQRLNDELDENGRKMHAIHEDVDNKISRDVDQYLIKDAEAVVDIVVNDEWAEAANNEPVSVTGAAFAFRRVGERKGPTIWQEGKTIILFGDWQQAGNGVFRGHVPHETQSVKAQTIKIIITADRNRATELLKQMDRKAILSLMK